MSLHVYLIRPKEEFKQFEIATSFFQHFKNLITVNLIKVKVGEEDIFQKEIENFTNVENEIRTIHQTFRKDINRLNVDFVFSISNTTGYLSTNNNFDSKIFGDIEIEVLPNKTSNDICTFFDLLSEQILDPKDLDKFFSLHKKSLLKVYVDVDEEGENNPLDILYEFNTIGQVFFLKMLKVVELLSEENDTFLELFDKIKSSDKNYVSSRLWHDEKIRKYAFDIAKQNNVVAQEGSFKLFAKDKEQLKKSYENMITEILNPIFIDIPSIDEKIRNMAAKIPIKEKE